MSAQSSVQRTHGMGEELATASDVAVQAQGKREASPPGERDPHERVSPDPLQGTDRYRLVMPFNLRL